MANRMNRRPFENFKAGISDPKYFFGREKLLQEIQQDPFHIYTLLGANRLGKTSTLNAIKWRLLEKRQNCFAFPVLVNLKGVGPQNFNQLLYILIDCLRQDLKQLKSIKIGDNLRKKWSAFIKQISDGEIGVNFIFSAKIKINNTDDDNQLNERDFSNFLHGIVQELKTFDFEGICFLMDESDLVVRQDWADKFSGFFRALKESDQNLRSCIGLVLSGYKTLKEYKQKKGSPLSGIAIEKWLTPLDKLSIQSLIIHRRQQEKVKIPLDLFASIFNEAGCHPYITQQMLNLICNESLKNRIVNLESLRSQLLQQLDYDFSNWWGCENLPSGSFGEHERLVYQKLIKCRKGSAESLEKETNLPYLKIKDALDILMATGVIHKLDDLQYEIGSQLFEKWVRDNRL